MSTPPVVVVADRVVDGPARVHGSIRGECSRCSCWIWLSHEDLRRTTRERARLEAVCETCHHALVGKYRAERESAEA